MLVRRQGRLRGENRARRFGPLALLFPMAVLGTSLSFIPVSVARAEYGAVSRDLTLLPIEQLLSLEVASASKFPQKATQAPSSVTVITAADIKDFGYRTLADILRGVRGLYVSYDRNYSYLGVRGFSRPSDYNSRVLLLVDGYRFNDNIYEQASIGTEFPIDVDLIDRVEFVPGPGSSIYGSNAFFGVINVITRRGADARGVEVAGSAGSFGTGAGRVSFGRQFDNGADLLLSATAYRSGGQDLFYPEFIPSGAPDGMARGLDFDRYAQFLARFSHQGWTLQAIHGERTKGIPTASFGTAFNVPGTQTLDESTYLNLGYYGAVADKLDLTGRVYYGRYDYAGDYMYDIPPLTRNKDIARGEWWGAEASMLSTAFERHKLVFGADYQQDFRQQQINYDEQPFVPYLDDRRSGNRFGIYAQDEIGLRDGLLLNAGLRYDRNSSFGGIFNPRLGLIFRAQEKTFVKLLYGTAYRAPNAYELYYSVPGDGGQKANPNLRPEKIRTQELAVEHYVSDSFRITGTVFRYLVRDLINATIDPSDELLVFSNLDRVRTKGAGFEADSIWPNGARLRASYNYQVAEDEVGERLTNSPRHLAKIKLSAPLPGEWLRAGAELQYTGARRTPAGETGGFWLGNLNFTASRLARGLELSFGIYNLFDRRYADPGGTEHLQDSIAQDGRSVRLKLGYRF